MPDDNVPQIANAALRIAVVSRVPDAAQTIWQEIRRRITKGGEFIALQSQGTDTGAAVFHLTSEDIASDEAVQAFTATMFASIASLNFLVRPLSNGGEDAQRRLGLVTGEMKKRTGFVLVPLSKQDGEELSEEDALLFQARGIANHLLNNPPALSSVTLSEFASHEKSARREGKTAKKSKGDDAAKGAKKTDRDKPQEKRDAKAPQAPAVADEMDKAARKAEKVLKKAERRNEKKSANSGDPPAGAVAQSSEGEKKDKSVRKAANAAAKAARASEREKRKADKQAKAAAEPAESEKKEKKDKKDKKDKTERKARKAAAAESRAIADEESKDKKRKKKDGPESDAEKLERKKAKGAQKKEERKKRKGSEGEDEDASRPVKIALHGMSESAAAQLRGAMERYLADTPVEWSKPEKKSDIAVYGFDVPPASGEEIARQAEAIAQTDSRLRIFLERGSPGAADGEEPFAAENRAIAALAGQFESPLIRVNAKLRRYGANAVSLDDVIATSVLGIAAGGRLTKRKVPRPLPPPPPDLLEARTLAATPTQFLAQLSWNEDKAPRLLWTHASKESAEAFMDRKIALSEEQTLDITVPIAWPEDASGRSEVADLFGLEFLSGPLNYWYSKANGRDSKKVLEVDAVLKQRGATASQILSQSGAIILDFVSKHPLSASIAWEESAVSRRARVLALYVLCCKMAITRKIRFDEAVCSEVILRLLDLIEALRSDDFYTPCSSDGPQQDGLVIGLALVLRGTAYAEKLLQDGLSRLKTMQFDPGLTSDGVWRMGSFSDHCNVLSQFRTLLGDFDRADSALLEPIAAAAKKMTVFAEAMQKSNGVAPAFDDSRDKSYARQLSGTRRALKGAGFSSSAPERKVTPPRMTETYVFRDAQYFVSHSTLKVTSESSLVILHADPVSFAQSNPGGVTLAFAYGATDLLVRAEPPEGEKKRDKETGFDPALCNGYRIDGAGFVPGTALKPNAARLEKSWRGQGWAAARSIDEINPAGSVKRTAIHLKAEHALIVVDELASTDDAETPFEQFWHIAPGLTAPKSSEAPYRFDLTSGGGMTAAFDTPAGATVEAEKEGFCVRRTLKTARGVTATLFQWSAEPAAMTVAIKGQAGNWNVDVVGAGLDSQLQLAGDELRYTSRTV